jgi:carboxyl-terminal processing protease
VKRGLKVVEAFKGSPAAKAGIKPGDLIVSVNGKSIAGESSELSTAKIKGPEGTDVTLGVVPAGGGKTRQVKLKRQEISTPVVESSLRGVGGDRLGYVHLSAFSEGAHAALRDATERVEHRGAQGIVLDLRGNPGGLLTEAVLTSSVFLPKDDRVVSTRSRTEGTKVYRAHGDPLPRLPMVVLIDRGTASAAEILASALADNGLAEVVGTRSFGKGLFQDLLDLSNGGELDLTVGEFFTADGISLAPKGIQPDVYAKDNPQTKKADEGLQRALAVLEGEVAKQQGGAQVPGGKSPNR